MKVQDITIKHHGRAISGKIYLPEKDKYPIVVFSHGFNGAGDDFRFPAETLAKNGIAALTYDFCGGSLGSKSDMQTYEMTVFTEKEDLISVLNTVEAWEHIDSNNIFLFGASMGGLVSALVAEEHADEIKGMILLFPAFCVADNWNERFPSADVIPQRYDVWGVPLGKCFFETLHGFNIFENVGKYSGNVLIMHGDKDDTVPVGYSERAQEIYQNAQLEIFPGEGHGFSAAGNDKVTQMLLGFIQSESHIVDCHNKHDDDSGDLSHFLGGVPAGDYVFQDIPYEEQIERASALIKEAETILIGAGAGTSTAAGLAYSGERFTGNFSEFIEKYGSMYMTDMYAAGFYPFPTQEAKWGYWSKHSMLNRFLPPAMPLYSQLYEMVKEKDHFVLTTNVDHQFQKAGFQSDRIFATQGDYGNIQCEKGCHPKVYDAEDLFRQMDRARQDCLVPSAMVPKCPVCGGNMTMYLRCDQYFVEDENWHEAARHYQDFLKKMEKKKGVLLELGVGFNTPTIIRFPFEKLVRENRNLSLIRLNINEAVVPESFGNRAIGIGGDMAQVISDLGSF